MMTVTLTTDMRPWRRGDDAHLPDDVAQRLIASGEAENIRPFNPGGAEYDDRSMRAGPGRRGYKTKGT